MNLTIEEFGYLGIVLESFLLGMRSIFQLLGTNLLMKSNIILVLGVYSGIFAMYLGYHSSRNDRAKSIIFYAVCVLYALTLTKFVLNYLMTFGPLVSKITVLPNVILILF